MKITHQPIADAGDVRELQQRLEESSARLREMVGDVSLARHVTTYDSDRRRRCLAIAALPFIKAGTSSAAADTEARASETYSAALTQLGKEFQAAEAVLADWDATRIQLEVCRSLLSLQKSQIQNL